MRVNHKNLWVYCNSYISISVLCEFMLPWDRCCNCWIALFTGSLQASFSFKFLSSQTRKKWRRLLDSAAIYSLKYRSQCSGSENTAFAPRLDKGRVSLGCLSFLQQKKKFRRALWPGGQIIVSELQNVAVLLWNMLLFLPSFPTPPK